MTSGAEASTPWSGRAHRRSPKPSLARWLTGAGDARQRGRGIRGEDVDAPGHRRIRRHRPEHLRRGAQLPDVGQAVPAHRQREGQIQHDLARIMAGERPPPPTQRRTQRRIEPDRHRGAGQQYTTGTRNDLAAGPVDRQTGIQTATLLHQKGAHALKLIRS
jgi:hypothetical protein